MQGLTNDELPFQAVADRQSLSPTCSTPYRDVIDLFPFLTTSYLMSRVILRPANLFVES